MSNIIKSFEDFHDAIKKYSGKIVLYRGVRDVNYMLIPKLGRIKCKFRGVIQEEKRMLRLFKEQSLPMIKKVGKFIPTHVTQRITAQAGLFTIHPNPTEEFNDSAVEVLIISEESRRKLKKELYQYGIHRASLFPDLDNLTQHIEWIRTDQH